MLKKLIVLASLIFLSYACLITNCPRGGKRGDIAPVAREVCYISFYNKIFFLAIFLHINLHINFYFIKILANSYIYM